MKMDIIQAMLANPECDPTAWFGAALLAWIMDNPGALINDPVCRDYLFRAMERGEARAIADGVLAYYQETGEIDIVKEYVSHLNALEDVWALGCFQPFESLCGENQDRDIASAVCNITRVSQPPKVEFINLLNVEDTKTVIKNFPIKSVKVWQTVFDRFMGEELEFFVNKEWIQGLDTYCSLEWVQSFQDVYYDLLTRLPANLIKPWAEALKEVEIYKVYGMDACAHLSKRSNEDYVRVKIDERMCRCGFSAKSRQGFALHQNKCGDGMTPLIHTATRVRLAVTNPESMICAGCGKQLKSKPGMTLHKKKCKPDPIYNEIRNL
jgi:hypothetical protein